MGMGMKSRGVGREERKRWAGHDTGSWGAVWWEGVLFYLLVCWFLFVTDVNIFVSCNIKHLFFYPCQHNSENRPINVS